MAAYDESRSLGARVVFAITYEDTEYTRNEYDKVDAQRVTRTKHYIAGTSEGAVFVWSRYHTGSAVLRSIEPICYVDGELTTECR